MRTAEGRRLQVAPGSLVVLLGASGSGKSTFARRHFRATEVVSSDFCRALVGDDASDQATSKDAFELLRFIAGKRLQARRVTVVDATNVREEDRSPLLTLARADAAPAIAIVLDLPFDVCLARNDGRGSESVPARVLREQVADLREGLARLEAEGFGAVYVLSSSEVVDAAIVERA